MPNYAATYSNGSSYSTAWIPVSEAQLRKKIYQRESIVYVGIQAENKADAIAEAKLGKPNIEDATATPVGGGMWRVEVVELTEEWTDTYKAIE